MSSKPEQNLFRQQLRHTPVCDVASWLLRIDGFTRASLTINYNTLLTLPAMNIHTMLVCRGHHPAAPLTARVRWDGASLRPLLDRAMPTPRARFVNVHSADGYATSFPISDMDEAILAHTLNGDPLTADHGFPVRLVVPGRYGYKQPKWLTHIILSDAPVYGEMEQNGWDATGNAPPTATAAQLTLRTSANQPVTLGGGTNAPQVDIAVDGGPWNSAAVMDGRWQAVWRPPGVGHYRLRVRAKRHGSYQPSATQPVIDIEAQ